MDDTSIHLGNAQISMFDRVFAAYFSPRYRFSSVGRAASLSVQAWMQILVPQVVDVEYSVPRDQQGQDLRSLDQIPVRFTGARRHHHRKVDDARIRQDANCSSQSRSDEAINLASTDGAEGQCGAAFITGFSKVPEVAQWLDRSIRGSTSGAKPVQTMGRLIMNRISQILIIGCLVMSGCTTTTHQ